MKVGDRPFRNDPVSTADLPETPRREYRIPADAWTEAPEGLLALGGEEPAYYLRRIGRFLLWRAGPPVGEAVYLAIDVDDHGEAYRFDLHGKTGRGLDPGGGVHERFRTWKEALRDA